MWDEVLKLCVSNGLFAVLFCGLLVFQLKDSAKREQKYQSTIEGLVDKLSVLEDIKDNSERLAVEQKKLIADNREIKKILKIKEKSAPSEQAKGKIAPLASEESL